MRILIINHRFFVSGGPERYMFKLIDLLESKGHDIVAFSIKSKRNEHSVYEEHFADPVGRDGEVYFRDHKPNPHTMLKLLARQFYSYHARRKLEQLIDLTRPDVCYILHHFSKLSASVIDACSDRRIPVVVRLSDFFLACPSSHLYRDGKVCEECFSNLGMSVVHGCVKGSRLLSLIKASSLALHRARGTYRKVSCFVCPSQIMIEKTRKIYPGQRFEHIPTFVDPKDPSEHDKGYFLYAGRIEPEKGVMTAVKAARIADARLIIAGDGSIRKDVGSYIKTQRLHKVCMAGELPLHKLERLYKNCTAVIVPSGWPENMPNVVLEAMSHGKPVIASAIGSLREMIVDRKNGLLFEPGNPRSLSRQMKVLGNRNLRKSISEASYRSSLSYSPEMHYQKLMSCFSAIGGGR